MNEPKVIRSSIFSHTDAPPRQTRSGTPMAKSDLLAVGLASWIVQDGNYGDFANGSRAAFALEFFPLDPMAPIEPPTCDRPSLIHVDGPQYEAVGRIAHVAAGWWVLDVGFPVYSQRPLPPNERLSGWVDGKIHIAIDHFSYFETLSEEADAPALIFDWKIENIKIQTAPWVEARPKYWQRDYSKNGWRDVDKTDAWHDDGGRAEYTLLCGRLDAPARRTLRS